MMTDYVPLNTSEDPSSPTTLPQNKRDPKFNYIILFLFLAIGITILSTVPSIIYLTDNESWRESSSLTDQTDTPLIEPSKTIHPEPTILPPKMEKQRIVGYFTAWSIYARSFNVRDIDASKLTHINYAFFNLSPDGKVVSGDPWADTDKHFDGDSWNDEGTNLYGNLKQLALLKQKYRHLKVVVSIGGYTWSTNFGSVAANPETRKTMIDSMLRLVKDYCIDGIDIDWEFPKDEREGANYVQLVRELRHALVDYAAEIGETQPFLITAALPCGPDNYNKIPLGEFSQHLDFLNLMAYDFSGSWSSVTGHQSNLYGKDISVDRAVSDYLAAGVPHEKIVIGIPMYGRAFENTNGLGTPYNGIGLGSFEKGIYDYKDLPREGAIEYHDEENVAGYSYDSKSKELVTYDTTRIIVEKIKYIKEKKLGGVMFWELSNDLSTDKSRSLLSIACDSLGGLNYLDDSHNHLNFPSSAYDNVRNQFGN